MRCIVCCFYGDAVILAVRKTQFRQLREAFGLLLGALRPVPHEQADALTLLTTQLLASQQPGYCPSGVGAACPGLHMRVQAQVQFALELQVNGLGQLPVDCVEQGDVAAPVLPLHAVPPADQLHQPALSVDEGDCYAIDLWLHPNICLAGQPAFYSLTVGQLVDAGVRHRMRNWPASAGQRGRGSRDAKALLQVRQVLAALVVYFIGHQCDALTMIMVVPAGKRGAQSAHFSLDLLRVPGGACGGTDKGSIQRQHQGEQQHERHGQHPCMAGGSPQPRQVACASPCSVCQPICHKKAPADCSAGAFAWRCRKLTGRQRHAATGRGRYAPR